MKSLFEKVKKFISEKISLKEDKNIRDQAEYNLIFSVKLYLINRLFVFGNEKIENPFNDGSEAENEEEIKSQLKPYLIENSLKLIDYADKNINIQELIFEESLYGILKYTIENYDKKLNFFDSFINFVFNNLLASKTFTNNEKEDSNFNRVTDYLRLFWLYNTTHKDKFNEDIAEMLYNKLSSNNVNNIVLVKIILKLCVDNLFEVTIFSIYSI